MLELKKKDTNTGFSELAESNKEFYSLKSGNLHRETIRMKSKQSDRSKILSSKNESRAFGFNTQENFNDKSMISVFTHEEKLAGLIGENSDDKSREEVSPTTMPNYIMVDSY
jgi:hypothetical protein